jgi:hypothetical protein
MFGSLCLCRELAYGRLLMTNKCDHCRRSLGLNAYRYWRMRFCSADCVKAYRQRLDEVTLGKVHCLEIQVGGSSGNFRKEAA